jgi:hypothetical protein
MPGFITKCIDLVIVTKNADYPYGAVTFSTRSEPVPEGAGVFEMYKGKDSLQFKEVRISTGVLDALNNGGYIIPPDWADCRPFDWGRMVQIVSALWAALDEAGYKCSQSTLRCEEALRDTIRAHYRLRGTGEDKFHVDSGLMKMALCYLPPEQWGKLYRFVAQPDVLSTRQKIADGYMVMWAI